MKAVGRAARAITGKIMCSIDPHLATGSRWSLTEKRNWRRLDKTKLGTEMPMVEINMQKVSCH